MLVAGMSIADLAVASEPVTLRYPVGAKTFLVEPGEACNAACTKASIDDVTLMDEGYTLIAPHRQYSTASFDALVVEVSMGGSGCESMFRIVWVTKAGKFGVTDEFGTCSPWPTIMGSEGEITLRFAPNISDDGEIYVWSPVKGIAGPRAEPFAPDLRKGWAELPDLRGSYYWEAFENAAVYDGFRQRLGGDFDDLRLAMGSTSPMTVTDDGIFVAGTGRRYTNHRLFIAIDPNARQVYAALRLERDPRWRFYPDGMTWPQSLQVALEEDYPATGHEYPWQR